MTSTRTHRVTSTAEQGLAARIRSADPAEQAFMILRTAFTVAPILFGLDKLFHLMVNWDKYLAPVLSDPAVAALDDIVSSGGTLIACAGALAAAGAGAIDAIVTHALFPAALLHDMSLAGIRSVRSTHSVPHPTNAIILDDLYAAALDCELNNRETST